MKLQITLFFTVLLTITFLSFKSKNEINNCYISFKNATNLKAEKPEQKPRNAGNFRTVNTAYGDVEVTSVEGFRIIYNNNKKAPFVNLKVELSDPDSYETDQKKIIDNLKYLNSGSPGMESEELVELTFNGYKISGLSRANIETGSTLGIFAMFPGNGVSVYFYFNNAKPGLRNFENVEEYRKQRDIFLDEYTKHLVVCIGK